MVKHGARWCNMVQHGAIPCNTMQYHAIPFNTMQYVQYHAIPYKVHPSPSRKKSTKCSKGRGGWGGGVKGVPNYVKKNCSISKEVHPLSKYSHNSWTYVDFLRSGEWTKVHLLVKICRSPPLFIASKSINHVCLGHCSRYGARTGGGTK